MGNHALLSASSSHRWLNCPPSARLGESYEDKSSDFVAEGTDAHSLCEHKLKTALGIPSEDPTENLTWYNEEMEECASGYAAYVLELLAEAKKGTSDPIVLIEQRLDYSKYVESGFGTGDCVLIADGTLNIVDYKHGKGVEVSADHNPQMMLYALGALEIFDALYDIDTVTMTIYQPRSSNVSTYTVSTAELLEWAETVLKPTAELAFKGEGEFHCGKWCQFCKAKADCRERARANLALAAYDFAEPPLLTDEEVEEVLAKVDDLVSWANDIKEYALQAAISGKAWNGWKVVEGRSNRKYTDEKLVAAAVIAAGHDPYEQKLLGITEMQKTLGKAKFDEILGRFITKPQGKPTLVPMSDKRPAMNTAASDFQGFAKGQFNMLDNLKLGYGGTKTEMERLLADAEAISGIHYDVDSYADVVSAIHVIQEEMDIAGTTAKEADATISGSISSLQSAIQNLIVGFGDADADMEMLCENMVDAFQTVVKNITPVIENIVKALPTVVEALIQAIADLLPTLLETVTELFSQVLTTLLSLLPSLIPAAVEAVMTIVNTLIENLPLLVDAAVQLITTLVSGIAAALPQLIPAAVEAVITIVQGLVDSLPMILDAALQLVTGLAQGILDAIPVIIEALPEVIMSIVNFILDAIPQIIDTGIQLLTSLVEALPQIIATIVEAIPKIIDGIINAVLNAIPQIIEAGIELLISLIKALPQIITTIVAAIPEIIGGIVDAVIGNIDKIIVAGVELFVALIENLPTIIIEIVKAVPQIITGIVEALGKGVSKMAEVGKNLVKGLWDGIQGLASWLWNKVSGWISSIWDGMPGATWAKTTIQHIIRNEKYCGDCLFQKAFIANPITHQQVRNNGELPKYLVEDCLPAIVDKETWKLAQAVAARHTPHRQAPNERYPFTGKLFCGVCGKPYYYYHYTTTNKQLLAAYRCMSRKTQSAVEVPGQTYTPPHKATFNRNASPELIAYRDRYCKPPKERPMLCTDVRIPTDLPQKAFCRAWNLIVSKKLRYQATLRSTVDNAEDILVRYRAEEMYLLIDEIGKITEFSYPLMLKTLDRVVVNTNGKLTFIFQSGIKITV